MFSPLKEVSGLGVDEMKEEDGRPRIELHVAPGRVLVVRRKRRAEEAENRD